jgi:hypothetical protein
MHMKKLIIKYLPDMIIITGIWILSYNLLRPETKTGGLPSLDFINHHTGYKVLGIILIAIGIDIVIRKYFNSRSDKK